MFDFGPRLELGQEGGKGATISNIVIVLVGFGLIFLGYNTYTSQNQALENPVNVSATVTNTAIQEDNSRRGGIDYQPVIEYEYSFEGQEYTSDNMYPGGQSPKDYNLQSNAEEMLDDYEEGTEINVSVPPGSPGEAFIKAKETNSPLFFIGIGVLFVIMGSYKILQRYYL
jgi:Protein of unknown function (DUF3592).